MDKLHLTSVKILKSIHLKFKRKCLEDEFTLQKFVNRALDIYNTDEEFKEKIKNYKDLEKSGSMI